MHEHLSSQNASSSWHPLPAGETEVLVALALPSWKEASKWFWAICHPWCRERFWFFSSSVQSWISGSKYARSHYNPGVKSVPSCSVVGLSGSLRGTSKVHLCPVHFITNARIVSWMFRSSRVGWSHNLSIRSLTFLTSLNFLAYPSTSKFTL